MIWLPVIAGVWALIATCGWFVSDEGRLREQQLRKAADAERKAADAKRFDCNQLCGNLSGRHARAVQTIKCIRQQIADYDASEAMVAGNPPRPVPPPIPPPEPSL